MSCLINCIKSYFSSSNVRPATSEGSFSLGRLWTRFRNCLSDSLFGKTAEKAEAVASPIVAQSGKCIATLRDDKLEGKIETEKRNGETVCARTASNNNGISDAEVARRAGIYEGAMRQAGFRLEFQKGKIEGPVEGEKRPPGVESPRTASKNNGISDDEVARRKDIYARAMEAAQRAT